VALDGRSLSQLFGDAAATIGAAPHVYSADTDKLACPHGCGPMWVRRVEGPPRVDFDVCRRCSTVWFDRGEAAAIVAAARARSHVVRTPAAARPVADPLEAARAELAKVEQHQATMSDEENARATTPWWLFALLTGLPVEGYNPLFRFPLVTWGLIVASGAVFTLSYGDLSSVIEQWGYDPSRGRLSVQLLTAMFIHASPVHLLGNMYFLKIFGDNVEDRLGRVPFLLLYGVCGVVASTTQAVVGGFGPMHLVGASGAIAGVLGAYLVYFPDVRISVTGFFTLFRWLHIRSMWYLPFWFVWQFVSTKLSPDGVAWWAHIGGFVAGVGLAVLLRTKTDARLYAIAAAR
jgi:membrane associated rhomboid family serine protease